MVPLLMAYSLFAGLLLLVAAHVAGHGMRAIGGAQRWLWASALAALLVLTAVAPVRRTHAAVDDGVAMVPTASSAGASTAPSRARDGIVLGALDHALGIPFLALAGALERSSGGPVERVLGIGWLLASGFLFAMLLTAWLRARRSRATSQAQTIGGHRVRVSRSDGPAVLGFLHPEIVVPLWLLDRPPEEQRMIVAHEREHLRARDPLLLLGALAAVVLLPWNPFAWLLQRRLRLVIELDCDARVVRSGACAHRYRAVLVAAAERRVALGLLTPALTRSTSDLERRLHAMNAPRTRYPRVQGGLAALAALAVVIVACEAELPTSAEIDAMDADAVAAATLPAAVAGGEVIYFVDGVETDAASARALAPSEIAGITVLKGISEFAAGTPRRARIEITTLEATPRPASPAASGAPVETAPAAAGAATTRVTAVGDGFAGLLFIDGERAEPAMLRTLDPATIESVEVVKGAAAARLHPEPEARNGVIQVRTKKTP